jgi:hypothetical protein
MRLPSKQGYLVLDVGGDCAAAMPVLANIRAEREDRWRVIRW